MQSWTGSPPHCKPRTWGDVMPDDDLDGAQQAAVELAKWGGDTWDRRMMTRVFSWARRIHVRIETLEGNDQLARDAIVNLRQRVKALEDAQP